MKNLALYKVFKVRHRYLFTRNNTLRLRYMFGTLAVSSIVLTGLLGDITSSVAYSPDDVASGYKASSEVRSNDAQYALSTVLELSSDADVLEMPDQQALVQNHGHNEIQIIGVEGLDEQEAALDVLSLQVDSADSNGLLPRDELLKIGTGDTIAGVLQNAGVSGADAYKAVKALSEHYDPRDVKPGQAISITLEPVDGDVLSLGTMGMKLSATQEIIVSRDDSGRYHAHKKEKTVVRELVAAKASIETSLYGSAARAGIPASVVADMIRIYSYEVDFQRDIRQGDKVQILYETYETEDGDFARYGNIIYASLMVDGREIPVYRYQGKGNTYGYYKEDGRSLKRTLMSTPIDGARMSSGFGMRRHPVLGYNKMHKGVDFAAPRGTPVYAAGDGVIEKASRFGAYGNYVRIKHNSSLKTAYAHLKGYAKGIRSGKRIKQGDVIGYVGTTGRSTGPHLHYEVLRNGKQVNPKSIKSSAGAKLAGAKLKAFAAQVLDIKSQFASLSKGMEFASNDLE